MKQEKKRLLALLLTVSLVLACVSGCTLPSGDGADATTTTTETTTTTTQKLPVTDSTAPAPTPADLPSVLDSDIITQPDTNPKPESAYAEIPAAAKAAGMTTLAFADEFDAEGTIDFSGEGLEGYNWYADRPYGGGLYTPEEAVVKDGVLTFAPESCASSIGISTFSSTGKTGYTMHFGYAEARIRFNTDTVSSREDGRNGWPAFWGVSVVDVVGEQWNRVGELDILEAYHLNDSDPQSGVIYTGTIHDHVKLADGSQQLGSNLVNASGSLGQQTTIDNEWHTYAALWTEGYIGWYMDGELMHAVSFTEDDYPAHYYLDMEEPLFWQTDASTENRTFPGAYSIMNDDHMVLFLGAHETWPIEVDWVRVWETPAE